MGGRSVTWSETSRASSTPARHGGMVKVQRLYEQAMAAGNPFIYLGQTEGLDCPTSSVRKGIPGSTHGVHVTAGVRSLSSR